MKHTELVYRTFQENVVTKVTCDICGCVGSPRGWPVKDGHNYEVRETKVHCKIGNSWPEGGSGVEYGVDICTDCFTGKLIPWLRSQGAVVREEEWDW